MQNKNFKTNIKSLLLALLFLVGITFTTAQNWSDPTSNPATNNPPIPITTEAYSQRKTGGLVTSGIINNSGTVYTKSNLCVGNGSSSNDPCPGSTAVRTPAYFFGKVYFTTLFSGSNAENKICVDPAGKLKVCGSIEFKALATNYYTPTNYFEYDSSGNPIIRYPTNSNNYVVGKVSYKTAGTSCSAIGNSDTTDWVNNMNISGTGVQNVTFKKWGTYTISMVCAGTTYTVYINVGGKFDSSNTVGSTKVYNLDLGAARTAHIYAVGGSGAGAREYHSGGTNYCMQGADGSATTIKVDSTEIVNAGPGTAGVAGRGSNCSPHVGYGGKVVTNKLTGGFANGGYSGGYGTKNYYGGCSGQPDTKNNLNTCHSGGVYTPRAEGYGIGGQTDGQDGVNNDSIGSYHNGGGGAAYVSGDYTLPATGKITIFVGGAGGQTINTPKGLYGDGHVWFDW